MIPKETIDKIFEAAKIEDVISDFVSLKKKGVNYIGNCPFHDEKTPSFIVSPTKGIFKCFGCGVGGNVVKFVMDIEHYNYPDALKFIAKKYNIEIQEEKLTEEDRDRRNKQESLFIVTKFANEFFKENLFNSKEGKEIGLSYFKERGFNKNIITKFELGYSSVKKNELASQAIKKGFDEDILIEAGLILKNEVDNQLIDRFRDRVIFPIHSFSGRVLGFGGRALNKNTKAKYLNSPESLIYYKSSVLYGLYQAKSSIAKKNNCFIVEGYTDVISMQQKNIENVVSASGTALGAKQIKLIRRLTDNITLLFDGDDAGVKATYRTIDIALKENMNVTTIIFPDNEDPDSYAKKLSSNEFNDFLEAKKINFVEYKILKSELKFKKDPKEIINIKRDIFSSISNIPDQLIREQYCKTYHKNLNISEEVMLQEVSLARKNIKEAPSLMVENNDRKKHNIKELKNNKLNNLEKEILRILINYGNQNFIYKSEKTNVAEMIISDLQFDNLIFNNPEYKNYYNEILSIYNQNKKIEIDYFIKHDDANINSLTADLLSNKHSISENWEEKHNIFTERENEKIKQTTEKIILSLKKYHVEVKIKEIQEKIKLELPDEKTLFELKNLTKLKIKISKSLGRNIG